MDSGEAKELGEFARIIARADLARLLPIIALTLDDCIDVLRRTAPPSTMIEMAAALAAELHKRQPPSGPPLIHSTRPGNA